MTRTRRLRLSAFLVFLLTIAVGDANALDYPKQTIKVVVPFAAAGVTDIVARVVFDRVSRATSQTIVIDNRPGAGGTIAVEQVVNAPPDGYTLVMADPSGSLPANVTLYPNLKYHPIRDLTPVAIFGNTGAVLLVNNDLPVKSAQDLVALGKSKPGELTFASTGVGTPGHLNGELFSRLAGIKSDARALSRGRAGRDRSRRRPHRRSGSRRSRRCCRTCGRVSCEPLAVAGDQRSGDLPGIPTVKETGIGNFDASTTYALFAPPGTPREIVDRLHDRDQTRARRRRRCSRSCAPPASPRRSARPKTSPRCWSGAFREWADVIKSAGIKIN